MEGLSLRSVRALLASEVTAHLLAPLDLPPRYTAAADEYLARCFVDALAGGDPGGLALVAVGGYGRRQLCPGSDLDVLLLHDRRRDVAAVAERLWYEVWDSGPRLDHSVRTPAETLVLVRDDLPAMLGLLGARLVCGDGRLIDTLTARVCELWRTHRRRLLPELAGAAAARHDAFGELAFLLEPDLKQSAGGLRDLEILPLLAQAVPELTPVLEEAEDAGLAGAHELLLAARVALQARTGSSSDRLALEEQDGVALAVGYGEADRFARALAAAGREVSWASADLWRRATAVLDGPGSRTRGRPPRAGRGVVVLDGEVRLATPAARSDDPALAIEVARAAAGAGKPISAGTLASLAVTPEPPTPWPPHLRDAFVSLLEHGRRAIPALESLDRGRLLERFLPEWAAVRHRPQRNAYHRYTVDRHLLEAVAEAAAVLREVERPDLLLLAALLHDIGKGQPGDHSEAGRRIARDVALRMGYPSRDVAVLERLVKRHLLLADTATRRDIDDPETIDLVAEAVGDAVTLELLARLTRADAAATGPAAWSTWKATLVDRLVANVRALLAGRPVAPMPAGEEASLTTVDAEGAAALPGPLRTAIGRHEIAVAVEGPSVTVVAPDTPGLFALVAGVVAMHRLDIRQATARTVDSMAVDTFDVDRSRRDGDPEADPALGARILADLRRALSGELSVTERLEAVDEAVARFRRPPAAFEPEPLVLVDEAVSGRTAIVEVRAVDSRALLHRIAACLSDAGLDVVSARIATIGHEVVDSFYVREAADGSRPSRDRLEALRPPLLAALLRRSPAASRAR